MVRQAVATAMSRLDMVDPELAEELRATVRTGLTCRYDPDPLHPTAWHLEADALPRGPRLTGRCPLGPRLLGMAEMSMNKVIHGAVRRDLDRFADALRTFRPGDTERAAGARRGPGTTSTTS